MRLASATDLAIALATRAGTLRLRELPSRFGGSYVAIEDAHGLIEVADSMADAQARVERIRQLIS